MAFADLPLCANVAGLLSADDLARECSGKEAVELAVAVDRDGGIGGGDADGDGELDEGADPTFVAPLDRVLIPLLTGGEPSKFPVVIDDQVFVMVGGWREALVEVQEAGRYLLHHGRGEKRWADGGEIAWHDIAPMPFDVAAGKPMLGWDSKLNAFSPLHVQREDGAGFLAKFDHGLESKVTVGDLRERWTLPLRVLGYYGDYKAATVLESLGGILRVDFGEGAGGTRWALPDELLAEPLDEEDPIGVEYSYPGSHVGLLDNWEEVVKG